MYRLAALALILVLGACDTNFSVSCSDPQVERLVQQAALKRIEGSIVWTNVVRSDELVIELEDVVTSEVYMRGSLCKARLLYHPTDRALARNPRLVNIGVVANTVIIYQLERTDKGRLVITVDGFNL